MEQRAMNRKQRRMGGQRADRQMDDGYRALAAQETDVISGGRPGT
jgi:hypothetical protein